jgi:hypothetical protein
MGGDYSGLTFGLCWTAVQCCRTSPPPSVGGGGRAVTSTPRRWGTMPLRHNTLVSWADFNFEVLQLLTLIRVAWGVYNFRNFEQA